MYSLCIEGINNKLFTGKLHFASCLVIDKVNLQRFYMNIMSRESNYYRHESLSSSKSLGISFVQSSGKIAIFNLNLLSLFRTVANRNRG